MVSKEKNMDLDLERRKPYLLVCNDQNSGMRIQIRIGGHILDLLGDLGQAVGVRSVDQKNDSISSSIIVLP